MSPFVFILPGLSALGSLALFSVLESRRLGLPYRYFWRHWWSEFRYGRDRVEIYLTLDTTDFQEQMRLVQQAAQAFGVTLGTQLIPAMRNLSRSFGPLFRTPQVRIWIAQNQVGMGNRTEDGLWQSDMCASWLHNSCPLPRHCDCRCHR